MVAVSTQHYCVAGSVSNFGGKVVIETVGESRNAGGNAV